MLKELGENGGKPGKEELVIAELTPELLEKLKSMEPGRDEKGNILKEELEFCGFPEFDPRDKKTYSRRGRGWKHPHREVIERFIYAQKPWDPGLSFPYGEAGPGWEYEAFGKFRIERHESPYERTVLLILPDQSSLLLDFRERVYAPPVPPHNFQI